MITSHHLSRMFAKVLHDLPCIKACGDRVALIEFWLLPWLESMQLQHYAAEGKSWCLKLRLINIFRYIITIFENKMCHKDISNLPLSL